MKTSELIKAIETTYGKYFPDSKIDVILSSSLYRVIYVKCYLAGNNSEVSNGIWDNDILNVLFTILGENSAQLPKGINQDTELSVISLENEHKDYLTKPESKFFVYGKRGLSFRKVQGIPEKIVKSLDVFFARMKESLQNDLNNNNIHDNHVKTVNSKLA